MFISAGYTKLLIGTGNNNSRQLNNIEIIDLETSSTSCQDLPNFPRSVHYYYYYCIYCFDITMVKSSRFNFHGFSQKVDELC